MAKPKKKTPTRKPAAQLRFENASLKGDFEIFLPEGWKVSSSKAKPTKRSPANKKQKQK